jgi:hypothetical protein
VLQPGVQADIEAPAASIQLNSMEDKKEMSLDHKETLDPLKA